MTAYISRDDSHALEHHGVKGMKWGVRRDKPSLGTSARTIAKRDRIQAKIDRSNDNNIITRNLVNDRRRGRVQALNAKAAHRQAKEAYKSGTGSKEKVRSARNDRLARNVGGYLIGATSSRRGRYNRYGSKGNDITTSTLKVAGLALVGSVAASQAMSIGQKILLKKMQQSGGY